MINSMTGKNRAMNRVWRSRRMWITSLRATDTVRWRDALKDTADLPWSFVRVLLPGKRDEDVFETWSRWANEGPSQAQALRCPVFVHEGMDGLPEHRRMAD